MLMIQHRRDWMLEPHEFLGVLVTVMGYFAAELATDAPPGFEDRFIEAFCRIYRANIEKKGGSKIL